MRARLSEGMTITPQGHKHVSRVVLVGSRDLASSVDTAAMN